VTNPNERVGDSSRAIAIDLLPKYELPEDGSVEFTPKPNFLTLIKQHMYTGAFEADPNEHLQKFLALCDTIRPPRVSKEVVRMTLFYFTLDALASTWWNNLPNHCFRSWQEMATGFVNKFFPPSRTSKILKDIMNFKQAPFENFNVTWERYSDLHVSCPHHNLSVPQSLEYFVNGLTMEDRRMLVTAACGKWNEMMSEEALQLIENLSRNMYDADLMNETRSDSGLSASSKDYTSEIDNLKRQLQALKNQGPSSAKPNPRVQINEVQSNVESDEVCVVTDV
jgi:hypothetical protein